MLPAPTHSRLAYGRNSLPGVSIDRNHPIQTTHRKDFLHHPPDPADPKPTIIQFFEHTGHEQNNPETGAADVRKISQIQHHPAVIRHHHPVKHPLELIRVGAVDSTIDVNYQNLTPPGFPDRQILRIPHQNGRRTHNPVHRFFIHHDTS